MVKALSKLTIPAAVLPLLLLAVPLVQGQRNIGATLSVTDAGAWKTIQKGVEFRRIVLERSEPGYEMELKLLRLDGQFIVPRVLHAGQLHLKSANAKTFADKAGAIGAINANYFDENHRPLAYLKTSEREINRSVSKHGLYTGVFGVGGAGPFVVHRDDFRPAQASQALQSGPLLLHHGEAIEPTRGLNRTARRSVVGIDKDHRLLIAVTDAVIGGLSFAELQELFSGSKWQLEAVELLNLDGGGSAQLYVKAGNFEEWLPGTTEVPVVIGFFSKAN